MLQCAQNKKEKNLLSMPIVHIIIRSLNSIYDFLIYLIHKFFMTHQHNKFFISIKAKKSHEPKKK